VRAAVRRSLAPAATALLVAWAIATAGATGWSLTVQWTVFLAAAALLAVRALL
jgi:hypothetical protein